MVVQAAGHQVLLVAVGSDQERHQHPDAATVHVLEPAEVEQYVLRLLAARLVVRVHEDAVRAQHVARVILPALGDLRLQQLDRERATAYFDDEPLGVIEDKDYSQSPFDAYNVERLRAADTLLLGRTSFDGFKGYWPSVADDASASPDNREISRLNSAIRRSSYRTP